MDDGLNLEKGLSPPVSSSSLTAAATTSNTNISLASSNVSKRTVRLVHCSDGVVEECDEDIEEQKRLEQEAREREIEARHKLDLEAKNLPWLPWFAYVAKKTAIRSFEGEKLAWWFGITKPKFLYEINEYEAMKREQERRAKEEDPTEEIVIGGRGSATAATGTSLSSVNVITTTNMSFDPDVGDEVADYTRFSHPVSNADVEARLYEQNEQKASKNKPLYQN